MTQESKELLLKDLSGRLPYGVKVSLNDGEIVWEETLSSICISDDRVYINGYCIGSYLEDVKPYLFPLSSMTEEQYEEFIRIMNWDVSIETVRKGVLFHLGYITLDRLYGDIDWFDKNHIDYRGLLEKGLAIDATGLNIY